MVADRSVPTIPASHPQSDVIKEEHLEEVAERHVRKAAREYAIRHRRIVDALHRDFAPWRPIPSAAGLHVSAHVAPRVRIDVDQVVRQAEACGVAVRALSRFSAETLREPNL